MAFLKAANKLQGELLKNKFFKLVQSFCMIFFLIFFHSETF